MCGKDRTGICMRPLEEIAPELCNRWSRLSAAGVVGNWVVFAKDPHALPLCTRPPPLTGAPLSPLVRCEADRPPAFVAGLKAPPWAVDGRVASWMRMTSEDFTLASRAVARTQTSSVAPDDSARTTICFFSSVRGRSGRAEWSWSKGGRPSWTRRRVGRARSG